jgi:hypothetical protein
MGRIVAHVTDSHHFLLEEGGGYGYANTLSITPVLQSLGLHT